MIEIKKRKKPVKVSSKTLKHLRDEGYIAEVVERKIPYGFISIDYIGCIDIIAFHEEKKETLGVQVTTNAHVSDHVKKILAEPRVLSWIKAGNRMVIHAWAKKGKAGKRKLWTLTEREIRMSDFIGIGIG